MQMNILRVLKKIFKNEPFSLKEAKNKGISRYQLNKLLSKEKIEKIARGIYKVSKTSTSQIEEFQHATAIIGKPCAVCLLSALEYYDLTDTISKEVWLMVPANKRTRRTNIKLLRSANPNYTIGVNDEDGFLITSIERTIVDSLVHNRQIAPIIGIEALRRAIQKNKTTLSKVYEMSKKLGSSHRIKKYIEALS